MTKKTIEERFEEFHAANPIVYHLFRAYYAELQAAGQTRFSAKAIMERIRWEQAISTVKSGAWHVAAGKPVKINDHYTSRYMRLFCREYPTLGAQFEQREIKTP